MFVFWLVLLAAGIAYFLTLGALTDERRAAVPAR
jgi:hypothetical protein